MRRNVLNLVASTRVVVLLALFAVGVTALAQPPGMMIRPGGSFRPARGGPPPGVQPGKPSGEKSDDKKEEGEKDKSDDDKKKEGEEKKDDDGPVKRPDKPPVPPDPRELEAKPDANGRVRFSFHGQAWADVLQWLANVSELSLDWRELPNDYLNLTTQRAYTLSEARDLINRHLQARGYTLMLSGEVLSVFKLDQLDPSLAPRVTEEDLYDRQPHDVVKLSLAVPGGLDVKKAAEDVKQALGPHAKIMPLAATQRLLLIDTVANLRMASALMNAERLAEEGRVVPREFVLKHVQAANVIDTLYVVLGLDPNSRPSQMELQIQQQKMQLMTQMSQSGKDVLSLLKKDGPPVFLAYNRQRNSVLANAPPAQMRIIERAIDALDVPVGGLDASPASDASASRTLKEYRLKSVEPNSVVIALEEIGDLGPRTELRGDNKSKTLFARATERDHEKIAALVERLDDAETRVEVFWLRRLPAEAVAGTIQLLMIEKPKKKKNNDYPFYFSFRNRNNEPEEPDTLLRVDADLENNRLLVRGTQQQIQEVRDLLVKMGEPLDSPAGRGRVRVLDSVGPEATAQMLEQLKAAWPSMGGDTELVLPPEPQDDPADAPDEDEQEGSDEDGRVAANGAAAPHFRLLSTGAEEEPAEAQQQKEADTQVAVQVDPTGRLVISSDDPAALDRLEELVAALAPKPEKFRLFYVTERRPDFIVQNLEVYFEDELKEENGQVLDWWGRMQGVNEEDEPIRLSRRRPLRFLADDWSSSILVANATPAQLAEIERLIKRWDRQPIDDRVLARRTATVKLEYSKASVVVGALKEVYRDLLSKRDKEFDTPEQKARASTKDYLTTIRFRDQSGAGRATEPTFIGFDGVLSLGADDQANVVIVSASEEIFDSVVATIRALDEEARPTTAVQVVQLSGGVATDDVRRALVEALGSTGDSASASSRSESSDRDRDRRRRSRRRR